MKKVLFATTALVASAGIASAEVALSGSAHMGIYGANGKAVEFTQDVDVSFKMTGETDNGLTFGTKVDLGEADNLGNSDDNQGVEVFISGSFGTLTMGDTDGAMDWALTEGANINNGGSLRDVETGYAGYAGSYLDGGTGGDGQIVRYEYALDQFSFAVSVEQDDLKDDDATLGMPSGGNGDMGYAFGVKGSFNNIAVGVGYQKAAGSNAQLAGLSLGYTMDAFSAGIMYAQGENAAGQDDAIIQVGAGYSANNISLHANYQTRETNKVTTDGWGLSAGYDLGGGATVKAGYNSDEVFSLGVAMSF